MRSWLAALVLLTACDGDPGADAGTEMDAGPRADAGAATDAGEDVDAGDGVDAGPLEPLRVLMYSRTTGFRHGSIGDGRDALEAIATARGWTFSSTEDPAELTTGLASTDVVVFLNTTGDVLDDAQQAAFESWLRGGGGWVGVHSAADTEYDWAFYGELLGAYFDGHPAPQDATLVVEDRAHPATMHLQPTWERFDEWYDFARNVRSDARVLITIDESTYMGGSMGDDHPMTWAHELDSGRAFYTAFGHTSESYGEPDFRALLTGAIAWAGRRE